MARGDKAKQEIIQKIINLFGQDCCKCYDKKLYINTTEDNAPIQVALSLVCPKTSLEFSDIVIPNSKGGIDFESMGAATVAPTAYVPAEISEQEEQTIRDLMQRLGL